MLDYLSVGLIFFLLLIFFLEILLHLLVPFVKKDFQWILTKTDENPLINDEKLIKFLNTNYSEETGWDRKPNTSGFEENRGYKKGLKNYKSLYSATRSIFNS